MIKAKTVFEFRGRHDVLDSDGAQIGQLEKAFGKSCSVARHVRDRAGTELFEAHESSWIIALVRRFIELGPDILALAAVAAVQLHAPPQRRGGCVLSPRAGKFRDRYVLEVGEELAAVDRRLVLAFAVALDALQDR